MTAWISRRSAGREPGAELGEAELVGGEVEVTENGSGQIEVRLRCLSVATPQQRLGPVQLGARHPRRRAQVLVLAHRIGEQRVGLIVLTEALEQQCP